MDRRKGEIRRLVPSAEKCGEIGRRTGRDERKRDDTDGVDDGPGGGGGERSAACMCVRARVTHPGEIPNYKIKFTGCCRCAALGFPLPISRARARVSTPGGAGVAPPGIPARIIEISRRRRLEDAHA